MASKATYMSCARDTKRNKIKYNQALERATPVCGRGGGGRYITEVYTLTYKAASIITYCNFSFKERKPFQQITGMQFLITSIFTY